MTNSPTRLIEQTRKRLVRQRQMNRLGIFLPLAVAIAWFCWLVLDVFAFPRVLIVVPIIVLAAWLWFVARQAKQSIEKEVAAVLIDEKTDSKDRFLTLSTTPQAQTASPLFPVLQRQVTEKTSVFRLDRDVPFTLDRRVLFSFAGSALCILTFIMFPPLFSPTEKIEAAIPQSPITENEIEKLQEVARMLMRKGAPPQEQVVGKQLLALAEKLKDPTLPQEEKQRLIEETQQKIQLSMPQLLPFDLKIFANDSKNDKGEGNQSEKPQKDGKSSAKSDQPAEQGKGSSSSGSTDQQQQGPQNNQQSNSKNQPQPKEGGGGIKFDQPQQPQTGEKKERNGQEPSEQQQSAQNQAPNSQTPGSDPNRPGGQDGSNQDQEKKGQTPNPQQPGQGEGGKGSTVSGGRGERFTQPGEQPGGFLTKDARFVKVRIPTGNEPQGKGDALADNYDPAQPKTPYSNAPLKDAPPDEIQPQQPIPLEYRAILK